MKILLSIIATLALLGAAYEGREAYRWKHWAEAHANLALGAGTYLFQPTEVKDRNGNPLRRVDLIDELLAQAVRNAQR